MEVIEDRPQLLAGIIGRLTVVWQGRSYKSSAEIAEGSAVEDVGVGHFIFYDLRTKSFFFFFFFVLG